jgi:sec-independent protein translocase protein TatA
MPPNARSTSQAMLTSILQPTHLIIVLIVALLVLGPKRLPDAGRAFGQGLKEFKSSINSTHDDPITKEVRDEQAEQEATGRRTD